MGDLSHRAQGTGPGSRDASWPGWRGRAGEWKLVDDLLRAAGAGRGAVLLIEGRPGVGKSRMLDVAAAAAARAGIEVARGVADELTELIPLAPLTSALGEHCRTFRTGDPLGAFPVDQRMLMLERLEEPLEQRVAKAPVLLTLDDLHWADPMTLMALRSMTRDLASYPLIWMLTRTTDHGDASRLDRLFDGLERAGAARIRLERLDERAVAHVVADVLGAVPEPDVLDLAELADGNPFLLVDLLERLRGEGVLEVAGGHARTVPARLPQAYAVTWERLERLSAPAQHMLRAAGVLGRSFSVRDLAELLGESTGGLLPLLEEAMTAGVIRSAGHELTFRHDLLWQAVVGALPAAVLRALHQEAGEMLLRRGGSAVAAATHLLHSAGRGETSALRGLDQAAREVLRFSPQTAADLARRALELSDTADADWPGRAATAVDALTAIGRLSEAAALARAALGRASPAQESRLRCALAYILLLSGRPADAVSEAEGLVARRDVSEALRGVAEWTVFWGLIVLNRLDEGRRRAEAVLADRERHTDTAAVGALLLLARQAMVDGRTTDSFDHLHEALRIANTGTAEAVQGPYVRLMISLNCRAMRQFEAADVAVRTAEEEIEALGLTVLAPQPALFRSCLRLATGRLDDALAEAQAGMTIAEELGTPGFVRAGWSMLALIAVRRGDIDAAARHLEKYLSQRDAPAMLFGSVWERWVEAVVAQARGDLGRAVEVLTPTYLDAENLHWALITGPFTAACLTRLALATAHRPYARAVAGMAERLAGDNPDFPDFAAAAAHARGILDKDTAALARAAEGHPQPWERASAAEDLGALLSAAPATRDQAVESLDRALDGYRGVGALRDAARVRARLRVLGVRRRHWAQPHRPPYGWDSLTDTERAVAGLIARGMTNRQAAARMFLSPHTVSTHLRRMFAKLGIASRVELARVVTEHCPSLLQDP
ncbi:AAA family ATPase [Sphaerisporangium sp. B11E5]|uniref:helix-turn-helix transcriptional regulator n=1 Tax=Sphaerisporangium sp. B11E5 TaxID=3153563 RepID=UPI00325D641D